MSYSAEWNDYRKRQRLVWAIALTYIPGVLVLGVPVSKLFNSEAPMIVVAFAWMIAFAGTGVYYSSWKCPRCGKPFFKSWYYNSFARRCLHCKLPKWSHTNR